VPYITAAPEVCSRGLTAADRYLILATDGVWEQATSVEVAQWVGRSGTSEVIIREVLKRAALAHDLTVAALEALPLGTSRRSLHDDVCATVVQLAPLLAATAEAAQVAASAAAAAAAISAAAAATVSPAASATTAATAAVDDSGAAADNSGLKDSSSTTSSSSSRITAVSSATEPAATANDITADTANNSSSSADVTMTDAPAIASVSCSGELATQQAAVAAASTATTRALISAGSGSL
jgi:Protein phosphatase 2C